MFDPTMPTERFGYREALAQVSAELADRLRDEHQRRRRDRLDTRGPALIDRRGLALN